MGSHSMEGRRLAGGVWRGPNGRATCWPDVQDPLAVPSMQWGPLLTPALAAGRRIGVYIILLTLVSLSRLNAVF